MAGQSKLKRAVFFLHIPKTGGTSLTALLEAQFLRPSIFPPQAWWQWGERVRGGSSDANGYQLYRGHFGWGLLHHLREPPHVLTILRDPVDRLASAYGHWMREHGEPRGWGFERWLDAWEEPMRHLQARFLGWPADGLAEARRPGQKFIFVTWPGFTRPALTEEELLTEAVRRLEQCAWVGVQGQLTKGVEWLKRAFGWTGVLPQLNVGRDRGVLSGLSGPARRRVARVCELDYVLFSHARRLLTTSLKAKRTFVATARGSTTHGAPPLPASGPALPRRNSVGSGPAASLDAGARPQAGPDLALVQRHGWWLRHGTAGQDWAIIQEVFYADTYYLWQPQFAPDCVVVDVGACLGAFPRLVQKYYPHSRILAVEANPKNLPCLRANCGEFATVVWAALTYEKDVALLDTVYPGTPTTGGSIVLPKATVRRSQDRRYRPMLDPLPTLTLEELMARHGLVDIDLLKLDCEGSEYSLLEGCTCLDKVKFLLGEYQGGEARFREVVARRLPGRHLHTFNQHGHMGNFWIYTPPLQQSQRR